MTFFQILKPKLRAAPTKRGTVYGPYTGTIGTKALFFFPSFLIFGLLIRVIVFRFSSIPSSPSGWGSAGAHALLPQYGKGVERHPSPAFAFPTLNLSETGLNSIEKFSSTCIWVCLYPDSFMLLHLLFMCTLNTPLNYRITEDRDCSYDSCWSPLPPFLQARFSALWVLLTFFARPA